MIIQKKKAVLIKNVTMLIVRLTSHWFFVKLLFVLFFVAKRTSEDNSVKECPTITEDDITWPRTPETLCTSSEPICINTSLEISRRCCSDNETWDTIPICNRVQQNIENPCPESSVRKDNICIFVITTSYPPDCPYEENLEIADYIDYVETSQYPIWLPVERENGDYGEGLFYWKEQSENYKTGFDLPFEHKGALLDKSCLIYYNSSYIEAVQCTIPHTAICAYNILPNRSKTFCSQTFDSSCKQSNYSTKSTCFCKRRQEDQTSNKIELLVPYQNLLYETLDEVCYIGLEKRFGEYIWTNSELPAEYTYWSPTTNFGDKFVYGAISPNGWILRDNDKEDSCTLVEKYPPRGEDEIILTYNELSSNFTVTVRNPSPYKHRADSDDPLLLCFTDAAEQSIIEKLDIVRDDIKYVVSFSFKALDNGSGHYWCESFLYPDLKIRKSKTYFLRPANQEYITILTHTYLTEDNPLSTEYLKKVQELVTQDLQEALPETTLYPRIFKIVEIDEENGKVILNFHLTAKTSVDLYKTYSSLLSLKFKNFSFTNLFIYSVCIGSQTTNMEGNLVTWPTTQFNQTAVKPLESWCVDQDGFVVTRYCGGNFIDGASWSDLVRNCSQPDSVSPTLILNQVLLTQNPNIYMPLITELTLRTAELQGSDVDLMSEYLKLVQEQAIEIDIPIFSELIDGIMNIPRTILQESQDTYNSTDKILDYIVKIMEKSEYTGTITRKSLSIVSFSIEDFYSNSVIWRKTDDAYCAEYLNLTDVSVSEIENFDAGIMFNEKLIENITSMCDNCNKIIIIAYFKPTLFNEHHLREYTSTIFSTVFPNFEVPQDTDIEDLVVTIYNRDHQSDSYQCSYWTNGHWFHNNLSEIMDSKLRCNFKKMTNIGLVPTTNVTALLEQLQIGVACYDTLEKVSYYLQEYYLLFKSMDVYLINKILIRCQQILQIDMPMKVIDGVLSLPIKIVQSAITDHNTNLLQIFEEISEQYYESVNMQLNNFALFIQYLADKDLTGFYVDCHAFKCSIVVMDDYSSIPTNSELYMIIDPHLLKELKSNKVEKVIVTLFANDILFGVNPDNQEYSDQQQSFSKVVGVLIPKLTADHLDGNISVTYTVGAETKNEDCKYWNGLWTRGNGIIPVVNGIYKCEFWNTGYYALTYDALNVTELLENLIINHQKHDLLYTLKGIENISNEYVTKLRAIDIIVVADFFEKIGDYNYIEILNQDILNVSVQIINNIMHVQRYILQEAERYLASHKILLYLNNRSKILGNPLTFCASKVLVTVLLLEEGNNSAIELLDSDDFCNYRKIETELDEHTAGILLSSELITQFQALGISKLVVTAYYNDVLFYTENSDSKTNLVFGIQIPDSSGSLADLTDSFSIFFNDTNNSAKAIECVSWQFTDIDNVANGSWELPRKVLENRTCQYFKPGWFTLWTHTKPINVTSVLQSIRGDSTERKLDQLEAASSYYEYFTSYDVSLLSQILNSCPDLTTHSLLILKRIGLNFIKIPKSVKHESQSQFYAMASILNFVSNLGAFINTNVAYGLENYIQIIACDITGHIGMLKADNNMRCLESDENNYGIRLDYYPKVNGVCMDMNLAVTIFSQNDLFFDSEECHTSEIIGISLSNLDCDQSGKVQVSFNHNKLNIPRYSCACWTYRTEHQYGTWRYFETIRENSVTICNIPQLKNCQYVSLADLTLTNILDSIYSNSNSDDTGTCSRDEDTSFNKLALTLNVIENYCDQFQPSHIDMIYKILESSTLDGEDDLQYMASIIDAMMELDRAVLAEAQKLHDSPEYFQTSIDNLIKQFEGTISIIHKKNFALIIQSNITGIIFDQSNSLSYNIKEILSGDDSVDISETSLIISKSLREKLRQSDSKLYITVYFNDALFIGGYNLVVKNNGIIIGVEGYDTSIDESMRIYFENYENQTNMCAYWNHKILKNYVTGYWQSINKDPCENRKDIRYFALLEEYNVTSDLEQIFISNTSIEGQLLEVVAIVDKNKEDLIPFDISLIADILGKILNEPNITKDQVDLTADIISKLYTVNKSILEESQLQYEATDRILNITDELVTKWKEDSVNILVYHNFTMIKKDMVNITGVTLEGCNDTMCNVRFVDKTLLEVVATDNFKTAIIFSTELLEQIRENEQPVQLIVSVHFHNNFFNEPSERNVETTKILGVLLEGLDNSLRGPVYLVYNIENVGSYDSTSCAFWKYQVNHFKGFWQDDVAPNRTQYGHVICEYDHITHFVLLLASSSSIIQYLNESHILDIVTNVNSILSLLGLFGILLTAVLFDRWRNNTGNQILINFTIAVSIKNVMLYISDGIYTENSTSMGCTITGGILHYSILSEFCWMLIIAILQFKRFVEVLGGPLKYVLLKACICGWAFPALPVFLIIIVDINNYNASKIGLCYPSGFGLYLGVWLPLAVIISLNFVIFVFILYNVFHKKTEYREQVNHEILFQWRLAILLFSMLGLTWSFGFLALVFTVPIFAIAFCFLATLQGFIMFLFFIVFNKNTRYLYVQSFSWWMYSKGYKDRLN